MNRKLSGTLIIIAVNILFLLAFLAMQIISANLIWPLHNQKAAKVWAGQSNERFAQLSVFFPQSYQFGEDDIRAARAAIDQELLAISLESGDGRTLYADAWSTNTAVSALGTRGSINVSAIAVGGDFFLFHPMQLRDGSYISPKDIMRDRVVLDEELAWRLYGSVQLSGMEIMIEGRPFIVAGVVVRESDFASAKAYDGGAGLFLSYESMVALGSAEPRIDCYEIVMPDPITDFAKNVHDDIFTDPSVSIVQNTSRFSAGNLVDIILSFGQRSMKTESAVFPYWENAARFAEDWLALLHALSILVMICPMVFGAIYGVKLIIFAYKKSKNAIIVILQKREDRGYKKYLARGQKKQDTL